MTSLEDIEKAVEELPPDKLAKFRTWFEEFDAAFFDAKIERDLKQGKLNELADAALDEHLRGQTKAL
jgi:hypothetical protein